jgi:imidazole glycerol-phosphate synthase subunit HisH
MITIIDYGIGNIKSVYNLLKKISIECQISSDYDIISKSSSLILPGVGSFLAGITKLHDKKIDKAISNALGNQSKLLGICLGMAMLFDHSEEDNCEGLKIINGNVKRFSSEDLNFKVPHMGWNTVKFQKFSRLKFKIKDRELIKFYFAHSYYAECKDNVNLAGITNYSHEFCSIVEKNNIFGVQFHPEKSHIFGMELMKKFNEIK